MLRLSRRGQLSLDLILALLIFTLVFSALFVLTGALSDNASASSAAMQKRIVGNEVAHQLALASTVPVNTSWKYQTHRVYDLNTNASGLYCGIQLDNVASSPGKFTVRVTYPGFAGDAVTVLASSSNLTLETSPTYLACGCMAFTRKTSSIGVLAC